mgnify:CR=1 FL=1
MVEVPAVTKSTKSLSAYPPPAADVVQVSPVHAVTSVQVEQTRSESSAQAGNCTRKSSELTPQYVAVAAMPHTPLDQAAAQPGAARSGVAVRMTRRKFGAGF